MYRLLIAAALLFFSCSGPANGKKEDIPPGKVRLLVTDAEINNRDMDGVLAPERWWVNVHGDEDLYKRETARFCREPIMVNAMVTYLEDTRKEGHFLFFSTTPPSVTRDAIEGFRAAGLEPYATILIQAAEKAQSVRINEVDLEDEDVQLLELTEDMDPYPAIWQFIRNNRKQFYFDQMVNKPE